MPLREPRPARGTLTLTNPTITATTPATITVNPGGTEGFCHYTVTGNDGTSTQTEGGWIVVGKPAATFAVSGGNNQSGSAGTALAQSLAVTLSSIPSGFSATGASVLFTTSAGTLSNGAKSGTSVIATTNSSGVASVTLTLPSSKGTVTVTAQDQFALGGATVTFSETARQLTPQHPTRPSRQPNRCEGNEWISKGRLDVPTFLFMQEVLHEK